MPRKGRALSDLSETDSDILMYAERGGITPRAVIERVRDYAMAVHGSRDPTKEAACRQILKLDNVILSFESPLTNSADSPSLSGHQHRRQR